MRVFKKWVGDINFLNILIKKLRRNQVDERLESADPTEFQLAQKNLKEGYKWISRCQGEINYIRASSTPIVYKTLDSSTSASHCLSTLQDIHKNKISAQFFLLINLFLFYFLNLTKPNPPPNIYIYQKKTNWCMAGHSRKPSSLDN